MAVDKTPPSDERYAPYLDAPVGMVDISLGADGRLLADHDGAPAGLALVRLRGRPVGYVQLPPSRSDLGRAVLAACEATIVDVILARQLLGESTSTTSNLPSLTVAICTRDRPDDLARCLLSLARCKYPCPLDVLVVENAPRTDAVGRLLARSFPHVRYVQEPCPGLNWARRCAVREARGAVLALVDDDVMVDPLWARAIGDIMGTNPDVAAVCGLVAPAELITSAQRRFEALGGLGKGFERRWHRRPGCSLTAPHFGNMGPIGIGANMAFRRTVFAEIGSFDPALGAGTPAGGGDDLDQLFRVLKAGHTVVYEPAALVRHRHRRDEAPLVSQMENWCSGMQAYLHRTMEAYPEERPALRALANRLLLLYHPRRLVQSLVDQHLTLRLAVAEARGAFLGSRRYRAARRQADELAAQFGYTLESTKRHGTAAGLPASQAPHVVSLNLDVPLPVSIPIPAGSDICRFDVTLADRPLGAVTLITGGHPVGCARLADALVAQLGHEKLDPHGLVRRRIRHALAAPTCVTGEAGA